MFFFIILVIETTKINVCLKGICVIDSRNNVHRAERETCMATAFSKQPYGGTFSSSGI